MSIQQKILFSIPSILGIFYLIALWFPIEFGWVFPSMKSYYFQMVFLWILTIIQIFILIRKLWLFKSIEKSIKTNWTILLLFFAPISSLIFIWKKIDDFEKNIRI